MPVWLTTLFAYIPTLLKWGPTIVRLLPTVIALFHDIEQAIQANGGVVPAPAPAPAPAPHPAPLPPTKKDLRDEVKAAVKNGLGGLIAVWIRHKGALPIKKG